MATAAAEGEREVSIGRVFGRAFRIIAGNPLATFAIAFLFGGVPSAALGYVVETYGSRFGETEILGSVAVVMASTLGAVAIATIAQAALVRLVIAGSEGGRASFGDSVGASLGVAAPLVTMSILSSLGIMLGLIFLIVPGLVLYVSWQVAASALVEEQLGPIASLKRSSNLVKGARWKVAALLLVMLGATLFASFALESIGITGFSSLNDAVVDGPSPLALLRIAANAVFDTIAVAAWGVVQTSLYLELRIWKEGPTTRSLAEIFG